MNMTAKQEKENFILHYLEDWIPERMKPETLKQLDELISNYCQEQKKNCYEALEFHIVEGSIDLTTILNAPEPE